MPRLKHFKTDPIRLTLFGMKGSARWYVDSSWQKSDTVLSIGSDAMASSLPANNACGQRNPKRANTTMVGVKPGRRSCVKLYSNLSNEYENWRIQIIIRQQQACRCMTCLGMNAGGQDSHPNPPLPRLMDQYGVGSDCHIHPSQKMFKIHREVHGW